MSRARRRVACENRPVPIVTWLAEMPLATPADPCRPRGIVRTIHASRSAAGLLVTSVIQVGQWYRGSASRDRMYPVQTHDRPGDAALDPTPVRIRAGLAGQPVHPRTLRLRFAQWGRDQPGLRRRRELRRDLPERFHRAVQRRSGTGLAQRLVGAVHVVCRRPLAGHRAR